ncbi:MAG TPA: xanthine dehydrogenase family protein subunit M [Haliangium sp.]|nr:xanthine dehydrogenase family protein subunit M [Haliangium sp.]
MKPVAFAYHRPATLEEALDLLSEHGDEAKILAGGQSLVPAMNFRLAQPAALIDINRVAGLAFLERSKDGGLRIGATTRQRAAEQSALVATVAPLVHQALPYVAHVQIRNRGTVGGSVAHADPAAELPAVMLALGARMRAESRRGSRWIAAEDFFTGLLSTALAADEILVEIELPPAPARAGHAFVELARRSGDYALAGVAVQVARDQRGSIASARIALLGVGEGPVLATSAAATLVGQSPSDELLRAAADACTTNDIEPHGDVHATPAYRRHLAGVLTRRALATALALGAS